MQNPRNTKFIVNLRKNSKKKFPDKIFWLFVGDFDFNF